MSEADSGLPTGQLPIPDAPKTVQDRFTRFTREIEGDDYIVSDPKSLRITRRPKSLRVQQIPQPPEFEDEFSTLLDLKKPGHMETIEYFYLDPAPKPGRFEFEHRAEVNFNVTDTKTEFSSISLNSPEGDQFGLDIQDISLTRSRKTVRITGKKSKAGVNFSVTYDYDKGKLLRAELETADGTKKTTGNFTEPEPDKSASKRDEEKGKTVVLLVGETVFLLRMPEIENFRELIAKTFPTETFRNPSATNTNNDASWRFLDWQKSLNIKLTQNGKHIPLQF